MRRTTARGKTDFSDFSKFSLPKTLAKALPKESFVSDFYFVAISLPKALPKALPVIFIFILIFIFIY